MKATSKRRHSEEGVPDRIRSDRRRVLRKHFTIAARAMCPVPYRLSCAEHTHLHRLRSQSAIKTLAALFANGVGKDMTHSRLRSVRGTWIAIFDGFELVRVLETNKSIPKI